jgi:Rrf2 family transcriptional regulator, nitric oxide-sensitive transcriptional repressor
MRLTLASDYALRTLLFAAARPERLCTIEEIAGFFGISRAHLKKVVLRLAHAGLLWSTRGRSGGFRLARPPAAIGLGEVLRLTERDFMLVECMRPGGRCAIRPGCRLPGVFDEAMAAFFAVLDRRTLADLLIDPRFLPDPPASSG